MGRFSMRAPGEKPMRLGGDEVRDIIPSGEPADERTQMPPMPQMGQMSRRDGQDRRGGRGEGDWRSEPHLELSGKVTDILMQTRMYLVCVRASAGLTKTGNKPRQRTTLHPPGWTMDPIRRTRPRLWTLPLRDQALNQCSTLHLARI